MRGVKVFTGAAASVLLLALMGPLPALADTIEAALVRAYQNNPQLNQQRAIVRATDEGVPQALSGYRPKVAVTATGGYQYLDSNSTSGGTVSVICASVQCGQNASSSGYVGSGAASSSAVSSALASGERPSDSTACKPS
mgnify:CR=1 FL=1